MGLSNGSSNAIKGQRGERGRTGVGFSLTVDNHFHIENKRLTNVSAPVDDGDVTTFFDLLKGKAGTTYVKNEPAKKANKSISSDYVSKSDLNDTNSLLFVKRTTHSNKVSVKLSTALGDQINHPPGNNGVIKSNYYSLVNNEL